MYGKKLGINSIPSGKFLEGIFVGTGFLRYWFLRRWVFASFSRCSLPLPSPRPPFSAA
jgi:hypothetical protein